MNTSVTDTTIEQPVFSSSLSNQCFFFFFFFKWVHLVTTLNCASPSPLYRRPYARLLVSVCFALALGNSKSRVHQAGFTTSSWPLQSTFIIPCTASLSRKTEARLFLLLAVKLDPSEDCLNLGSDGLHVCGRFPSSRCSCDRRGCFAKLFMLY